MGEDACVARGERSPAVPGGRGALDFRELHLLRVVEEHRRAEAAADGRDRNLRGHVARGEAPRTNPADRVRETAPEADVQLPARWHYLKAWERVAPLGLKGDMLSPTMRE